MALAAVFLLVWINAAVGGILGDDPANMMYFGVLLVGLIGALIGRLKPQGMSRALFAICGVAGAVANAIYNATGVRVRDFPITLDKLIDGLPAVA